MDSEAVQADAMTLPGWVEIIEKTLEAIPPSGATFSRDMKRLIQALAIAMEALENHGHEREDDCIYHEAMRRIEELK